MCPSGQVARTGKDAVFGNGVLWRTGRRAGHEGVPSQDAALVFQGVLPGAVDRADCPVGGWRVPVDAMKHSTESGFAVQVLINEIHREKEEGTAEREGLKVVCFVGYTEQVTMLPFPKWGGNAWIQIKGSG